MSARDPKPSARAASILVIEDDRALREGLVMNLRRRGHDAVAAANGDDGLRLAVDGRPDLIVLDIMLPGCSGLEILETLRKHGERVPVLILSARGATGDKVTGLNLGADDYMAKPFDLTELLARVEAMLRRQRADEETLPVLALGPVRIDRAARLVTLDGKPVELSAREFDLLRLLAEAPGHVFTRDAILEQIWGWDYEGTARTIDNYVVSLRRKLRRGRREPPLIKTVPRVGYKLDLPPAGA